MAVRKLTGKQQRFVEEYVVDRNARQAAVRAGYSARCAQVIGCENLTKPMVVSAIAELSRVKVDMAEVSCELVVSGLLAEANYFGEGASHGARVSAWEKLGRYLDMFVERKAIHVDAQLTHNVEDVSVTDQWLSELIVVDQEGEDAKPSLQ